MQGWIKIHRDIKNHWLYQEKRQFSKLEAWIDLLMEVNHKDMKVILGSEIIEVKRGQKITSIRKLCDRWNWSNTKVKQFFQLLEADGMATIKSDTKKTLITVEKYDFYQCNNDKETTEKRHKSDTKATQKHTNKNDKELKNVIEDIYTHWNDKKITVHRELTKVRQSTINARLEKYSVFEIKKAIDNYLIILESDNHFYSHKFNIETFLNPKNLDRFLDINDPFSALLKHKNKGGSHERTTNNREQFNPDELSL